MPVDATEYIADLHSFAQGSETESGAAFSRLWGRVERRLFGMLRNSGVAHVDCEDMIQTACLRAWNSRFTFRPQGPGAWWSFVRTTTIHCLIDEIRASRNRLTLCVDEIGELPEDDIPYVDTLVLAAEDMRQLSHSADRLWLGVSDDRSENELALLAAQFYYLDGMSGDEIVAWLAGGNRTRLDDWLGDPAVLRNLAYHALFRSNDSLAGEILNPGKPYGSRELDELAQSAYRECSNPPDGWTWNEVLLVLWRIRNGLTDDQILRFDRCPLGRKELEDFYAALVDRYPFVEIAKRLDDACLRANQPSVLREPGVWRRLVFQYRMVEDLPHRQILERTARAAEHVGFKLNETTLTGWIGMGRLTSQLAAYVAKESLN